MLLSLPLAENVANMPIASWADAPLAAFLIPLIGLMMAPIYPVINSVMLSALPQAQHAPMTGLIVVFSALGGTTGSIVTGFVFDAVGGQQAFYLSLIPIGLLVITLFFFKKASTTLTEKRYLHSAIRASSMSHTWQDSLSFLKAIYLKMFKWRSCFPIAKPLPMLL